MNEVVIRIPQKLQRIQIIRSRQAADAHAMQFEEFDSEVEYAPPVAEVREETVPRSQVEHELKNAYDRGFEDGREVTSAMLERELGRHEEWLQNFDAIVGELHREFSGAITRLEECAVSLGVEVARFLLQREVQTDPAVVVEQVRRAFARVSGIDMVTVRLHPSNVEALERVKSALIAASDGVRSILVQPDESVAPGGCVLETAIGTIDAQIGTQLEQIKNEMLETARSTRLPRIEDLDFSDDDNSDFV